MSESGFETSSLDEVEAVLDGMENPTSEDVWHATLQYSDRAVASVAAARAGSGGSMPAQWTVDPVTGALTLDLTLPTDGAEYEAFVVKINDTAVLRAYLATDGTPLATVTDLQLGSIWRDEVTDTHPTIQVLGGGLIRSRDLPTADPHVSGEFWNDAGTMKISAG